MTNYLLDNKSELDRLRLQSMVWEPDAAAVFDEIGVRRDWRCLDLGCGAMGVLRVLSERAGHVVGADVEQSLLDAAATLELPNVELRRDNIFASELPPESFDLVHMRFMFAPIGRDAELLRVALALLKPGGVLVVQEPDSSPWKLLPPSPRFDELKARILAAFRKGGGDFDAGLRTFAMLREAGLRDPQMRAFIHALPAGHPYLRVPLQFARSLHLDANDVEADIAAADGGLTFAVTAVWATKP